MKQRVLNDGRQTGSVTWCVFGVVTWHGGCHLLYLIIIIDGGDVGVVDGGDVADFVQILSAHIPR
jgi:hypothetical protein